MNYENYKITNFGEIMRIILYCFLLISINNILAAKVLNVGADSTYSTLSEAALVAQPGDTIMVNDVVEEGTQWISELKGNQDNWIYILATDQQDIVYSGNVEAWHLSDCAYIYIKGFKFEGQSGNGVNIDDAGTFDTPSHNINIENCEWRIMNASGNNDQLKMSGVDDFIIRNCNFSKGSEGGSMVDLVGCHNGLFDFNFFNDAGANAIQAKGGSKDIWIERNLFTDAGERAVNIGGSTDSAYFRPQGINYEASNIYVHSNVFVGSTAPIAFVGTVNSEVVNNTIVNPGKWAIRILQENTDGMLQCSNNIFKNNIVYIQDYAAYPTLNIGPNTLPETFEFSNNLWYNWQDMNWTGPNLPVTETDGILGKDPLFKDYAHYGYELQPGSPAIGKGKGPVAWKDRHFNDYKNPPSIGAYEDTSATNVDEFSNNIFDLSINPNPSYNSFRITFNLIYDENVKISLYNIQGEQVIELCNKNFKTGENVIESGTSQLDILSNGIYYIKFNFGKCVRIEKVILLR
ncbi:MAG: T9SS type A sorting domain-containing protein [Bacteroidetes bacterium]|nr:MAG: T9SS type A sorting domain-containing protein [Bacteroidota bacterium]